MSTEFFFKISKKNINNLLKTQTCGHVPAKKKGCGHVVHCIQDNKHSLPICKDNSELNPKTPMHHSEVENLTLSKESLSPNLYIF